MNNLGKSVLHDYHLGLGVNVITNMSDLRNAKEYMRKNRGGGRVWLIMTTRLFETKENSSLKRMANDMCTSEVFNLRGFVLDESHKAKRSDASRTTNINDFVKSVHPASFILIQTGSPANANGIADVIEQCQLLSSDNDSTADLVKNLLAQHTSEGKYDLRYLLNVHALFLTFQPVVFALNSRRFDRMIREEEVVVGESEWRKKRKDVFGEDPPGKVPVEEVQEGLEGADRFKPQIVYTERVEYKQKDGTKVSIVDLITRRLMQCGFRRDEIGLITAANPDRDHREGVLDDFTGGRFKIIGASGPIGTGISGYDQVAERITVISFSPQPDKMQQLYHRLDRYDTPAHHGPQILLPVVKVVSKRNVKEKEACYDTLTFQKLRRRWVVNDFIVFGEATRLNVEFNNEELNNIMRVSKEAHMSMWLFPSKQRKLQQCNSEITEDESDEEDESEPADQPSAAQNPTNDSGSETGTTTAYDLLRRRDWENFYEAVHEERDNVHFSVALERLAARVYRQMKHLTTSGKVGPNETLRLVDFGAGTGALLEHPEQLNPTESGIDFEYIGLDHHPLKDPEALAHGSIFKHNYKERIRGDLALKIPPKSVHIAVFSFSHWGTRSDWEQYIETCLEVMVETGWICVVDTSRRLQSFLDEQYDEREFELTHVPPVRGLKGEKHWIIIYYKK
ncbi:hypothetical protein HDV00_008132 [Rhizophlyctis rosea]|nr:hypothetical protein HDV00_008132 [Rhizophlyctis rosea]